MTGILPPPGAGTRISGPTLGGHSTPSVRASLSLRFSPVVLGADLPPVAGSADCMRSPGAQPLGSICAGRSGMGGDWDHTGVMLQSSSAATGPAMNGLLMAVT